MPNPSTVLILGASRGLGLALVEEYLKRGWNVVATRRGDARTGLDALRDRSGDRLQVESLDIVAADQVAALRRRLAGRVIDLLFVNAGVALGFGDNAATATDEEFMRLMLTNALAPLRAIEAFQDLVPPTGTIAVMSSVLGSVAENEQGGWEVYRASKAALNTLLRSYAARHAGDPRTLLAIAPGWVRTDMGGPNADLTIEESIPRVVDLVTRETGKPGLQYLEYQGRRIAW